MAPPTKKIFSVGLDAARYFALTSAGYPAATNATPYSGVSIGGPISLALETAAAEVITHPGNNTILQYDVLPGNGITGGTLTVSREDADAIAAFTNTKVHALGAFANAVGWNTDQSGQNPTMGLVAYDHAKDPSGNRIWRTHVIPRCIITPQIKGMARDRGDLVLEVQPQRSTSYLTGLPFNVSDNGFTSAQIITFTSYYRLAFAAWVATSPSGLQTFLYDTDLPKRITGDGGQVVYKNGVLMTYGADADNIHYDGTTLQIEFGAALTAGDVVVAMYEIAETAVDIDT